MSLRPRLGGSGYNSGQGVAGGSSGYVFPSGGVVPPPPFVVTYDRATFWNTQAPFPAMMPADALLHFDGGNGSAVFIDSSTGWNTPGAKTVTGFGGIAQSTAQIKFGTSSVFFDGVDDYLTVTGSDQEWSQVQNVVAPAITRYSCYDFWFYATAATNHSTLISGFEDINNYWSVFVIWTTAPFPTLVQLRVQGGVITMTSALLVTLVLNTWIHFGLEISALVGGVNATRPSFAVDHNFILQLGYDGVGFFTGYMDEFAMRGVDTFRNPLLPNGGYAGPTAAYTF